MHTTQMPKAILLVWASISALAQGATLMSKIAALHPSVKFLSLPEDDQVITLQVGIKMQNINLLNEKLKAVSSPNSPDYGKYLDVSDINKLFGPSDASHNAVMGWLKESGVDAIADHGSYINFATTISKANEMLGSSFQAFDVDGVKKIRTLEYSVPDEMTEHIDLVSPTTFFGRTQAHAAVPAKGHYPPGFHYPPGYYPRQNSNTTLNCARLIEPGCLEKMYNYGGYRETADSGSRVGFGSFLNQSAIQADLTLYQKAYNLPLNNFTVVLINGGEDHQDPTRDFVEANLDSQFMSAVVKTLPVTEFITAGKPPFVPNLNIPDEASNTNEPYLEYYQALLNMTSDELPQVISNSYGDDEQTVPKEYAIRVCNLIGMMGLRGITVLESSGDTGVGAPCQSNDGRKHPEFTPQFPASCPYITSVGGTQAFAPEVAWSASSGGFSNYFARAWYQEAAVTDYLTSHLAPDTKANFSAYAGGFRGRAFPDVSAHSLSPNYLFYAAGSVSYTGGTSAAAPVVAGLIGLINDARLKAGKPVMGFINPWLYGLGHGNGTGITDVTGGAAIGCTGVNLQTGRTLPGASVIPGARWAATPGWDPATGVGMPDLEALVRRALQ
ncbi:Pro-kumamolisin [Coniochaeta sp. 2T2.1]|nr:Pro-kumamolisin [Coniochaeta sp. 2T2.1]